MPKRPYEWRVDTHGCYEFDNAALSFGPRDQTAHFPVFLHLALTRASHRSKPCVDTCRSPIRPLRYHVSLNNPNLAFAARPLMKTQALRVSYQSKPCVETCLSPIQTLQTRVDHQVQRTPVERCFRPDARLTPARRNESRLFFGEPPCSQTGLEAHRSLYAFTTSTLSCCIMTRAGGEGRLQN